MALYLTLILVGVLLLAIAIKGTEYQNKFFSIPAISVKARVYTGLTGVLTFSVVALLVVYGDQEQTAPVVAETEAPAPVQTQTRSAPVHHEMKLYCCNSDTGAKVCPIEIALGSPGLPCYCAGGEGAGIICQ